MRRAVLRAYARRGPRAGAGGDRRRGRDSRSGEVGSQRCSGSPGAISWSSTATGRVSGAYPFTDGSQRASGGGPRSDHDGRHVRPRRAGDRRDAGADACLIRSACRQCRRSLAIHAPEPGPRAWARSCPRRDSSSGPAVATPAAARRRRSAPLQAFFCDADHLAAWRARAVPVGPPLTAFACAWREALEVGRAIFAPMLGGRCDHGFHYDLIVIGSGTAAQVAVGRVRAAGWSVAVIDHRPFGGTCALRGCDPKRMLVSGEEAIDAASAHGRTWRRRRRWRSTGPSLMAFKRSFTDPVPAKQARRYAELGVDAFHGACALRRPGRGRGGRPDVAGPAIS